MQAEASLPGYRAGPAEQAAEVFKEGGAVDPAPLPPEGEEDRGSPEDGLIP